MKIAILSCFYPFRGGIAQFNANLLTELSKEHDVRAFNFSRQYPSLLFPGKSQFVSPEDEAVKIESSAVLDTANPFNWSSAAKSIISWGPDVLILRYWMSYFAPSLTFIARKLRPQCRVIAILDNVIPHERHFFDNFLTRRFLKNLDGCVTLCEDVAKDLLQLAPNAKHLVLHHPVYSHFGESIERDEAEEILGLKKGKKNLLFFGLIREYKGLDILLQAFNTLSEDYQLIIAGECYGSFDKYQKLIEQCPDPGRIKLFPDYIRDSQVKNFFSAADLVVLPYRSATQSGIAAISTHFRVPLLVTDVGGLKETIGDKGIGLVCPNSSPECVREYIESYFANPQIRERLSKGLTAEKEALSWNNFCKSLALFINSIPKQ